MIKFEPAREVTHTNTSSVTLSIVPIYNFKLIGALPCSLTPGFKEAFLSSSELSWYTQGVSVWAESIETDHASFDLELYPSELINAGLQIRVSTITGEVEPELLYFPPGSLSIKGIRLHINIGEFMQRIVNAKEQSTHLFQQQYTQHSNTTPHHQESRAKGQRTTENTPFRVNNIRETEQRLNREREQHLKSSNLY